MYQNSVLTKWLSFKCLKCFKYSFSDFGINCCSQTFACKIHTADHFRYFAPHCHGIIYLQKSVTIKQTFPNWPADDKFLLSIAIAGPSFGKETLNTAWIFSYSEISFLSIPKEIVCEQHINTEQLLSLTTEGNLLEEVNPHLIKLNYGELTATLKEQVQRWALPSQPTLLPGWLKWLTSAGASCLGTAEAVSALQLQTLPCAFGTWAIPAQIPPFPNLLLHGLQQDWNSHENFCCAHTRHEKAAWSFTDTLQGDRDNSHPPWCWL